jgi:NAD(P)-dependent dehydrogenase (short-subunit alcohol dehydrogenase family)
MELGSLVAWVTEGDEALGRGVALALAARGARVLVTGKNERAIAECVGEIAHAGGKARHFVGDAGSEAGALACADACVARFGAVGVAVVGEATAESVAAWARSRPETRVVTLATGADEAVAVAAALAQIERG